MKKNLCILLLLLLSQLQLSAQIGLGGYDPENPPQPGEGDTIQYVILHLISDPINGGAFTWGVEAQSEYYFKLEPDVQYTVNAYPSSDYVFSHWTIGGETVGTERSYTFTAPDHDIEIVCHYTYYPASPANPGKNYWNEETGDLIVTDFRPGQLWQTLADEVGQVNLATAWYKIKSVTVAGTCSSEGNGWDDYGDWNAFTDGNNITYIDMSRTVGLDHLPAYSFQGNTTLTSIHLPASTERIMDAAFRQCTALRQIICHATTPPVLGEDVFKGTTGIVVSVPSESMPLYAAADGWKDFSLTPIVEHVSKLTVSLPIETDMSVYKDMFLELINKQTGHTRRFVVTDRQTYTFTNLIHNTSYNAYIRTPRGGIVGRIDNIVIIDSDVEATFSQLKKPVDVGITLVTPDGSNVGNHAVVTWTDTRGNYLGTGSELTGQVERDSVMFSIRMDETLATQYLQPKDSTYIIRSQNDIRLTLAPIPHVTIGGAVTDEDTGLPVRNATVTAVQLFNGQYHRTLTAQTDHDGQWTLTVSQVPTELSASSSQHLKQTITLDLTTASIPAADFALAPITGTVLNLNLYYRPAVAYGEESVSEDLYEDYSDISYTVYDPARQCNITDMSVQYPVIVLTNDEMPAGSRLRVTATSKSGAFMPVETECRVDSMMQATVSLGITQLGILEASFDMTDNLSVVGMVYNSEGLLCGYAPYTDARLKISGLPDGSYTLITMGYSSFYSSVATLEALRQAGIAASRQCTENSIELVSGRITQVHNDVIPVFDEDSYSFTGENTQFTVNKETCTVGQYVTLRSLIDFKPAYAEGIDDVKLIIDLPEECSFVEESVMAGTQLSTYYIDGHSIVVPVDRSLLTGAEGASVRFCAVPTSSGLMQPAARVSFRASNGRYMVQPIGSAAITVEDMTISAPALTAVSTIMVSGMAPASSQVQVYEGDALIGQTTSLLSGSWMAQCTLPGAYNMSEHVLHAVISTPDGITMQSQNVTTELNRGALAPVVTMRFFNHLNNLSENVVWDFRTVQVNKTHYSWPASGYGVATFQVDFMNGDQLANDTLAVSNVMLYVLTEKGNILEYPIDYNKQKGTWITQCDVYEWNLPINVYVDFYNTPADAIDRQELDDMMADVESDFIETQRLYDELRNSFNTEGAEADNAEAYEELQSLLDKEDTDDADLERMAALTRIIIDDDEIVSEAQRQWAVDFSEVDALLANNPEEMSNEEKLSIGDKLSAIVNGIHIEDSMTDEEIAQEELFLQELDSRIKALGQQMYDVVYDKLSMFYPDIEGQYPAHTGDYSIYIEADSLAPGRYYTQKKLDAIDADQLLADGYTENVVTDDSRVFFRVTDNSFSYLDTKNMLLRTITVDENGTTDANAARASVPGALKKVISFVPASCRKDWDLHIGELKKYYEQMKDASGYYEQFRNNLAHAKDMLKLCTDALGCMWEGGLEVLNKYVFKNFGEGVDKEAENEIKKIEEKKKPHKNLLNAKEVTVENAKHAEQRLKEYQKFLQNELKGNHLSPSMRKAMEEQLANASKEIEQCKEIAKQEKGAMKVIKDFLKTFDEQKKVIQKEVKDLFKFKGPMQDVLKRLPQNVAAIKAAGKTIVKGTGILGKVFGTVVGSFLQIIPMVILIDDNTKDMAEWDKVKARVDALYPCESDKAKYEAIVFDFKIMHQTHASLDVGQIILDAALIVTDAIGTLAPPLWLLARIGAGTSIYISFTHPRTSQKERNDIINRLNELRCQPNNDPVWVNEDDPPSNGFDVLSRQHTDLYGKTNIDSWFYNHPNTKSHPKRDPSGYVYEAVSSNRLEGVTATCYYKETAEDMYGDLYDRVVVWDAENYAQQNPLFTDSEGKYAWDVPQGLWQVKYEKEGYETTHSDWLPVPPPQLEVNIGMTQLRQPIVQRVKAYTDGIDITFDKYMNPATLTADNIFLTAGGSMTGGTVTLLNEDSGYQQPDHTYASKVRFVPNSQLPEGSTVQLTVRRTVESYAGLQMENDYTQPLKTELRVTAIETDSLLYLSEGAERKLTVRIVPAEAAKGKTLTATSLTPDVVTVLPMQGEAEGVFKVTAHSIGSAAIMFRLADHEVTARTIVHVKDSARMVVATPKASRMSGTEVYRGSELKLTCATSGATILYTLDGSCPCDPLSPSVRVYNGPIVAAGDSIHIRTMAMANGMADSEVADFRFKVVTPPDAIDDPISSSDKTGKVPVLYFRLDGMRTATPQRGLYIKQQEDGKIVKVTK